MAEAARSWPIRGGALLTRVRRAPRGGCPGAAWDGCRGPPAVFLGERVRCNQVELIRSEARSSKNLNPPALSDGSLGQRGTKSFVNGRRKPSCVCIIAVCWMRAWPLM